MPATNPILAFLRIPYFDVGRRFTPTCCFPDSPPLLQPQLNRIENRCLSADSLAATAPYAIWKQMKLYFRILVALSIGAFGLASLASCSGDPQPLTLAPHVDLSLYSGRWYVIANIPYFAENGNVGSYFDISFHPGDKLTDIYTAHPKVFAGPAKIFTMNGYVVPGTGNARWRESPLWPLYLSYLILYVDPDYQTALVGYPGRGYGWVFARQPVIDDVTYQSLLGRLRDDGYDTGKFRRVPQTPAQIGGPGFQ